MRRIPALAGALALSCTLIPTMAQAKHGTYHRIGSTRHMTLQQVIHAQKRIIRFDQRLIARWEASRWVKVTAHVSYATPASLSRPAPVDVRYARAQLRWVKRELRENLRAKGSVGSVGHVAGWLCIHSREGSWTAQTGNGYYGGLQMTYGWMGLVTNAALMSPAAQMRAAETGYRQSGYSHAWLAGQWPNTYPPCAAYF